MEIERKSCVYEENATFGDPPEHTIWFGVPKETLYRYFRKPEEGGDDYGNVIGGCLALTMDGTLKALDPKQTYRLTLSPVVRDDDGNEHDADPMALTDGIDYTDKTIQDLLEVYFTARIESMKARQEAGTLTRCPRCGKEMAKKPTRCAVSRNADIYVCDTCGTLEALYALQHNGEPEQLKNWACATEF